MASRFRLLFMLLLLALTVLEQSTLALTRATTSWSEAIIVYRDERDLDLITSSGCSIERTYRHFNTVLALCTSDALVKIESYGLLVAPNANVSISVTVESFRVVKADTVGQSAHENVTQYWSWAVSRVSADIMWWYLNESGSNAVIAILDTGIDPLHPLLAGKLAGWAEFDAKGRPLCTIPRDTHGHGTWVASIAVGGDGVEHIFGVAPNAKVLAALVLPYGSGTFAQVLAGIEWALDPYDPCTNRRLGIKPNVVSMSFGALGNYSNVFLPAIAKLIENGIVPVAAIGNGGPHTSSNPGNIWGVIGVGALDLNNNVASFSSYEEVEWPDPPQNWPFKGYYPKTYRKPDVVAPGVDIPGAFPGGLFVIGSGTSAATPIVAGIAAIVSAKLKEYGFSGAILVERVYEIITTTTIRIGHRGAGSGLVNFYQALSKSLGLHVKTIDIIAMPMVVQPLDTITVMIVDAIPITLTTSIDVYISGVKVYSGTGLPRQLQVKVPLTHMDKNPVVVVSSSPALYGKTFVTVVPKLMVDTACKSGEYCNVTVSGIGIGDLLGVYLGFNMMTLDFANLRGTYRASLLTPLAKEGSYNLTVVDFTNPQIVLRATINVVQPHVKPLTALPSISAKPYYLVGTTDFVDIYVHGGIVEQVQVVATHPASIDVKILNITALHNGLHRIWIDIGAGVEQEVYVVMNALIAFNAVRTPYLFTIRVLPKDSYWVLVDEVKRLSENYEKLSISVAEVVKARDELSKLGNEVENLEQELGNALESIRLLNTSLSKYREEYRRELDSVEEITRSVRVQTVMALALATASLAAVAVTAIRFRGLTKL